MRRFLFRRGGRPRLWLLLTLALSALTVTGSRLLSLESRLIDPRLSQNVPPRAELGRLEQAMGLHAREFTTAAGLKLSYALLSPAGRGLQFDLSRRGQTRAAFEFSPSSQPLAAHASALLVHGWGMDRSSLYPWALALSEAGYQVLLVDLRGHGRSGDAPPGYGTRESADLAELLDSLDAQAELPGPLHLFGVSYGAATAAHLAARRPQRFASVLMLEPFARAGDAVRQMVPTLLGRAEGPLWRRPFDALLRLRFSARHVEQAIARSGEKLGLDLDAVELAPQLRASPACQGLLHGRLDRHVAVSHARRLATEVPGLHYLELPREDHITLPARLDWLRGPVLGWMRRAEQGHCGALSLPPDPLLASGTGIPAPGRLELIQLRLAAR
jgi:pimeloyl-ACP methyl ester carboxylesterase